MFPSTAVYLTHLAIFIIAIFHFYVERAVAINVNPFHLPFLSYVCVFPLLFQ